jgi:hypothetical protein
MPNDSVTLAWAYARYDPRGPSVNGFIYHTEKSGGPGELIVPVEVPHGSKLSQDGVILEGEEHPCSLQYLIQAGWARPAPEHLDYNQYGAMHIRHFLGMD